MADSPFDEAPAAWRMWQWVTARISAEEIDGFAEVMRGYRDEAVREALAKIAAGESSEETRP